MMGHRTVETRRFRNPYRDLAVALAVIMFIGSLWVLSPWFPWK